MRIGMTVHASSICVLPYTCGGSLPASADRARNFTTAYTRSAATTTKMIPVIASANRESSTIERAGVEAGAKMLVRLGGVTRHDPSGLMSARSTGTSDVDARWIAVQFTVRRQTAPGQPAISSHCTSARTTPEQECVTA